MVADHNMDYLRDNLSSIFPSAGEISGAFLVECDNRKIISHHIWFEVYGRG